MSSYQGRDVGVDLKEEERSNDSQDVESQSDRDFIAPEGSVEEELEPALLAANILGRGRSSDRLDVSIFNTFASGGGSNENSAPTLVKGSDLQSRASSLSTDRDGRRLAGEGGLTMRVGDLNPSIEMDSLTVAEEISAHPPNTGQYLDKRLINPSGGRRQAEWQTGLPTLEKGAATMVTRAQAPARDPRWTEDRTKEEKAGLPTRIDPEPIPTKPARPHTKGEVIGLKWSGEEEEEVQVNAMSLEDEAGLQGMTIQLKLEKHLLGLEDLNALCINRALLVERQDQDAAARLVDAQEDYRARGPIQVMLQDAESTETPQLSLLEFVAGRGQDAVDDFKLFKASKQVDFTWREIVTLMAEASRLLPLVKADLERVMGEEGMAETMRRHLQLEEGLSSGEGQISREAAQLFPKATAGDILQWYSRLVSGMMVMISEGQRFKRTTATMAGFIGDYPGPNVPYVSRQNREQEGWRGSLQARLLGEDSMSRYLSQVDQAESQQGDENSFHRYVGGRPKDSGEKREAWGSPGENQYARTQQGGELHQVERRPLAGSREFVQLERERTIDQAGAAGQSYRVGQLARQGERGFAEPIGNFTRSQPVNMLSSNLIRSNLMNSHLGGVGAGDARDLERERQQSYADEYLRRDAERERIREQALEESSRGGGSSHSSRMVGLQSVTRPMMEGLAEEVEEFADVDGFETLTRGQLEESIRKMVVQKLKEQGCDSEIARNIICNRWPMFNLHPRAGRTEDVRYFDRSAKLVKPTSKGSFMAMDDWFEAIKDQGDAQGWSIRHRIKWLKTTGGLAAKVNDAILSRVKDKMKTILTWIPDYDPSLASTNNNYWFQVWADVAVMLIKEFFTTQHADQVEEAYMAGLAEKKFAIDESQSDPLNKEWYKFSGSWEAQETMLVKRGSEYLSSPLFVWNMFKRWWERQGKRGAGKMMVDIIERALNKLSTTPLEVFPAYHNLSEEELEEVRRAGKGGATMSTYGLIMEFYKRKAGLGELTMVFTDFKMMDAMTRQDGGAFEKSNADKKKERKANAVKKATGLSSDVSALTLNTAVTQSPAACAHCGLYHTFVSTCPLVKDGKISVEAVIKYRSVRQIHNDGKSSFNNFWKKKFRIFVLPKLGIVSDDDQAKWFRKVEDAMAKLPAASADTIKKYMKENAKFINLVKEEEARDGGRAHKAVVQYKAARRVATLAQPTVVEGEEESSDSDSGLSDSESSFDLN